MSTKARISSVVLLACVLAVSSAAARGGASERGQFKLNSTLDGKKVLPLRLRWVVRAQLPKSEVARVDFLIDGKVRWIEHNAPYVYGADDNGRNRGFLITTWLRPGKHRFSARVMSKQGTKATHTVIARVLPAPEPPAQLAGTWRRTVTAADLIKAGPEPPPAGEWELVFDRVGAWHLDPKGSGVVNQYDVQPSVIRVYAPIWMAPNGISRFGHKHLGGNDCTAAGPFGSYKWSVADAQLTLDATKERCAARRAIWEGVWTRAD